MRNLLIIWLVFYIIYDNWIPSGFTGKMVFFISLNIWIGAISIYQAFKTNDKKEVIFYLIYSIIMLITALCVNVSIDQQAPPGLTWFNVVVIIFLISFMVKWTGLKKIFGSRF